MADLINLNKARKARDKRDSQARAAENRVRFGRTKVEKDAAKVEAERRRRDLDGAERDR